MDLKRWGFILFFLNTTLAFCHEADSGKIWLDQARRWEQNLYQNFSDEYFKRTVYGYAHAGLHFYQQYQKNNRDKSNACLCLESYRELVEVYLAMENPRAALLYFQPIFHQIHNLSSISCAQPDYKKITSYLYECAFKTGNENYKIRYSIAVLETYSKPTCDSIWNKAVKLCMEVRDYENLEKLFTTLKGSKPDTEILTEMAVWRENQDAEDLKKFEKLVDALEHLTQKNH